MSSQIGGPVQVATAPSPDRTRAIMRALKATAPAAQAGGFSAITPSSIASGPSPLVASYNEWTSGRAAGTRVALPRDHDTFLSGMFGPLSPIQPIPIDTPEPGEDRPEPRRFQYPVGWNMPMGMPGTEGLGKLADFQTLRTLADLYSVARACIELRKSELRGIGWDIALTKDAAKALRGDAKGMADFSKRRAAAVKFFRRPDPLYADFSSWFDAMLEEIFVTDSLSLYIQPALGRGKGLLGSQVAALDLLDGTLIRPLVDVRGGRPVPPNPAYQQFEYGVPRVDLMTLLLGEDNPEHAQLTAEYRGDQLMYLPYSQRTWTPYGQAPIERAIIPVMTGLNKQQYALNFYQEGSIPGLFISPGDPNMTPAQIRELQDALNALAGDQAWKHKIIVLPGGSHVDPQKPVSLADQADEIIMVQVCMAFNVMPMELGISPRVSSTQSTGAANQMAKSSQDIQERKGTVPLLLWLKSAVFDAILQGVCGQADMEWAWEGLEEDEDAETLSNLLVTQVGAGLRSIDEGRQELGLDPWGLPQTSDPGWASATGFVTFPEQQAQTELQTQVQQAAIAAKPAPGQPGQPGAAPPGEVPPPPGSTPAKKPAPAALPPGKKPSALSAPKKPAGALPPGSSSTPAHAGAAAAPATTGTKPGSTAAPGKKPGTAKAQERELGLLRSYLRKGMPFTGWEARDLPAHALAFLAGDLADGYDVDAAITAALTAVKSHTDVTPHDGHGDLTHEVYAYLGRHYPASVLEWVKEARWHGPESVKLKRISMGRRPGGARNPAKVAAIAEYLNGGGELAPVVLVKTPGSSAYEIADGWHRTLAVQHTGGKRVQAWIGDVDTDTGPWDGQMNRAKLNKAAPQDGGGGIDPKAFWHLGWDHDRALALDAATTLAVQSVSAVDPAGLAAAWLGSKAARKLDRAGLAAALTALLERVLSQLWRDGYTLGRRSAAGVLGTAEIAADEAELAALVDGAQSRIPGMAGTRVRQIENILSTAGDGSTAAELTTAVGEALGDPAAWLGVTQTETTWSMARGMAGYYGQMGVTSVGWSTAGDERVCIDCSDNQDEGPIAFGTEFPSGDVEPPAHVNCRCALYPGDFAGISFAGLL